MSILDDLAKSLTSTQKTLKRVIMPDGLLSISDGVFLSVLQQLNVDIPSQIELMEEPVENRQDWIYYLEVRNEKNNQKN